MPTVGQLLSQQPTGSAVRLLLATVTATGTPAAVRLIQGGAVTAAYAPSAPALAPGDVVLVAVTAEANLIVATYPALKGRSS